MIKAFYIMTGILFIVFLIFLFYIIYIISLPDPKQIDRNSSYWGFKK